jgi:hypothetical protein
MPINPETVAETIHLQLTRDKALVLFKWLATLDGNPPESVNAGGVAQWHLHTALDKVFTKTSDSNHEQLVQQAQPRLSALHNS